MIFTFASNLKLKTSNLKLNIIELILYSILFFSKTTKTSILQFSFIFLQKTRRLANLSDLHKNGFLEILFTKQEKHVSILRRPQVHRYYLNEAPC